MPTHSTAWHDARHLLARAGFGGLPSEIDAAAKLSRSDAVAQLLAYTPPAIPQPQWLEEVAKIDYRKLSRDERREAQRQARGYMLELTGSWVTHMVQRQHPGHMLHHRMTFFWHSHFATSQQKVRQPEFVFQQLTFFYANATGNFADLLRGIIRDPAMLRYLDNQQNKKGKPNENLARELMELFSLGQGNYTEQDIREGARALTGYSLNRSSFQFRKYIHDSGPKTILGKTGNFTGDDFVDIILEQPACASFIAAKLWRYFAGTDPSDNTRTQLADTLRQARYELKPLLTAIFTHPDFYSPSVVGQQIKSPVQLLVGASRSLQLEPVNTNFYLGLLRLLGQVPYAPPNVKGWPDDRAWIDTSRLISRFAFAELIANGGPPREMMRAMRSGSATFTVDPSALAKGADTPQQVLDQCLATLLAVPAKPNEVAELLQLYQQELTSTPDDALRHLVAGIMLLPQFQLT